ncbi:MAG: trimethylamine methyltransferase family protein [Armatimonadetes bacterium]|nr:trimethylamine methyltransferase family protein [Armatimonadota bacterium]
MFQIRMFKDADIEPLAEGVLETLERAGILFQNEEILNALEAAGAKVDHAAQKAYFPRRMVLDFVDGLRKETAAVKTDEQPRFQAPAHSVLSTQVAQFYHDYAKKERHPGNSRDFISLIKFGDALHREEGMGHALLLTDVPPIMEPLEAALLLAEYAHNPGPAFAWNVSQVDHLREMGRIIGIDEWFTWGSICIAHPFRFDKDVADKFARRVKEGVPTGITAMPIAGVSTPVTIEGFVAVSSAEHFAAWIAARALNPKVGLGGNMWGATMDMKSGQVSYSAYDSMIYAFACVEFIRRWSGLSIPVGGGEYCDAREPGLYAALEKAYKALTIAAFSGVHPQVGEGMVEDGKTISPVQLLLDRELSIGLRQYEKSFDPGADNIGMESILEVGQGIKSTFLQSDHTLEHYRECLWLPQIFDRSGWNGFEFETQVLDRAQEKVDALIASYRKPEGREDKIAAMREVVDRARKRLVK